MDFTTLNTPNTIEGTWFYNKTSHILMGSDTNLQPVTFHLKEEFEPNSQELLAELNAQLKNLQLLRQMN